MKNIINWTFGGFFRSIGRYLAIFVIFIVVTFILSISGLKLPSWLSFQVVNAAETNVPIDIAKYRISYQNYITLTDTTTGFTNGGTSTTIDETKEALFAYYSYLYFNNSTLSAGRTYNILLTYTFSPVDSSWFSYISSRPDYLNWSVFGNASASATNASEELISTYHVSISPICDTCSRFRVNIVLVPAVDIKFIGVKMDMSKNKCTRHDCIPSFHSWNYFNFPTGSSYQKVTYNTDATINAINNQNIIIENNFNEVNNNINNINDTLNDTDTSSDSSDASDWFHDFSLSIETPISDIVLLPINFLQELLIDYNATSSHADLCTTFMNKQICLPSGDILWKRSGCHDNSPFGCPNYSAFKTFFQLVVGGFLYYKLLRRLVSSVEKGLDPQESGVNMIKL